MESQFQKPFLPGDLLKFPRKFYDHCEFNCPSSHVLGFCCFDVSTATSLLESGAREQDCLPTLCCDFPQSFIASNSIARLGYPIHVSGALYVGEKGGVYYVCHIWNADEELSMRDARVVRHITFSSCYADALLPRCRELIGCSVLTRARLHACSQCITPLHHVPNWESMTVCNKWDKHYRPFSGKQAIDRAVSRLGDGGYNLVFNNCE